MKIDAGSALPVLPPGTEDGAVGDPLAFVRRLTTALWVYDIDNARVLHANAAACDLWQAASEDDLRARDMSRDMSPTVAKRLRQYQSDFIRHDATFNEMWTLYPKGEPRNVMVIFRGLYLNDGRMAMLCEVQGQTEEEPDNIRSAEALLHTDVMIALYQRDGPPLYMNPAARNAEWRPDQKIRDKFVDPAEHDILSRELAKKGEHRMIARMRSPAGQRWHDLSARLCSDAVTGEPAILMTAIDVSELKTARDKARYLADRDQLTGCYNRSYLLQHLRALPTRGPEPCALLCFDIDHFKQINDRFGHGMGDLVLKEISARVKRCIRRSDVIVRLGGDEFVVVFDAIPEDPGIAPVIDRLMTEISRPIRRDSTHITPTVSMGVTRFLPGAVEMSDLVREADIALYESKQNGRNRVTYFNEAMGTAAKLRNQTEMDLKRAIENRDFVLHYQPRFDLGAARVSSVEALVRWRHPDRGLVMPGEFIPLCEETGLIEDLGQLVLELGFAQVRDWQTAGLDHGLSINISPRQFEDERLLTSLRAFARDPAFPAGRIELEITESVLIGNHGEIEAKLAEISRMGYRIAIDDFGTGYSNLSYISRFPLDCLKIDQSFVAPLPRSGPVVRLILTLAQQIGATVVAEGVETRAQYDWLRAQDCDQVQGFLLSRAVPAAELPAVIARLARGGFAPDAE